MKNRTLIPLLSLAIAAGAVSGCGYRPLYGSQGVRNATVQSAMAGIRIVPISNRNGQMLRNALIDRLTPGGQPSAPAYKLSVTLTEHKVPLGIRKDETATRANMNQQAIYVLQEADSGVVVDRASVLSTTSYNIVSSDFGTIMAERDARSRGIELLAEQITLRLGLYFNRRKTLTKSPARVPDRPIQKK